MDDQPKRIHTEDNSLSKSGSDKVSSFKNVDNDNSNHNSNEDNDVDVSESMQLQQTRQRNAIYSKRKYYKKKQFVEQLKVKKGQLESSNKQLRSDNTRLETLIRQAKQRHQLLLQQQATAAVAGTMTPSNTIMTSLLSLPKPRGSTLAQLMTSDSSSHNRLSIHDDVLSLHQNNAHTNDLCSLQTLLPHQRNLCDNDWRPGATMNDVYESSLVHERARANDALSAAYASHNDLATLSTQRQSIHELSKMLSTTTKPNISSLDLYRNHQRNDDSMIRNASQALALRNIIDNHTRNTMSNVESIIGIPTTTTTSASSSSLYSMQRDQGMNYNSRYYSTLLANIATNGLPTATTNTMYPTLSLSTQQQPPQQDKGDTNLTLLQMLLRHQSEQR